MTEFDSMIVLGVSPIDRIAQQGDELDMGQYLSHPFRGMRMEQVRRASLPGHKSASLQMLGRDFSKACGKVPRYHASPLLYFLSKKCVSAIVAGVMQGCVFK